MNKLYPRLAWQNLRKNSRFYIPYLLTVAGTVAAFYILCALNGNNDLPANLRYIYLAAFTSIGLFVVGLFSVIFLFYTNSFLMKRRGKEIGLYNILGMGKRNIAAMLGFETLYVALAGILGGIGIGIVLQRLMTLLLWKLMGLNDAHSFYRFSISVQGIVITAVVFGAVLLLTLLGNLRRVHVQKPVELLHSDAAGEREPKTRWFLTLLGIVTLGAGYFIAVTAKNAMEAVSFYFVAVFLVIIGTYCLFTSVSIAVLKLLRKNKRYYYKTGHFIGISGMLYRMKRNGVGLANICILSTMVLVMISGTLSLYLGTPGAMQGRYPSDVNVKISYDPEVENPFREGETQQRIVDGCERLGLPVTGVRSVSSMRVSAKWTGACWTTEDANAADQYNPAEYLVFLTADGYESITGKTLSLGEGEVLMSAKPKGMTDTLMIDFRGYADGEQRSVQYFHLAGVDTEFPGIGEYYVYAKPVWYIVLPDMETLRDVRMQIIAAFGDYLRSDTLDWSCFIDTSASDEELVAALGRTVSDDGSTHVDHSEAGLDSPQYLGIDGGKTGDWTMYMVDLRCEMIGEMYAMNGGFFFLGIFLGVLFLLGTVLIMYYKQLSEGYEDRARFQIMQQVGLQKPEIRRSVDRQLLIVFFAPLLVAAVHIAFDFRLIRMMLTLFMLNDIRITLWCTLGTFGAFALLYLIVYRVTARVYYKIVQ